MNGKETKGMLKKVRRILPFLRSKLAYSASGVFKGYAGFPRTIYIGITNKCNLKCKMCDLGQGVGSVYKKHLSPKADLPLEDWKRLIDEVTEFNPAIEFCAAEPLLYKGLIPLVKYIKKDKGLECRIYSNGYFLEEQGEQLSEADIDQLIVSIDGPPQIHDYIRGMPGLFEKVALGLKRFQNNRYHRDTPVDINYTICEHNFRELRHTLRILMDYGIKFTRFTVILTLFVTRKMAEEHNRIHPELPVTEICETGVNFNAIDTEVLKSEIIRLMRDYPKIVRFYPHFDLSLIGEWYKSAGNFIGNNSCHFVWNSASITSEGEVIPFVRCVDKSFGNITKERFKLIWNSDEFRKFRITTKKSLFPICARCSASFMK